MSKIGVSKNHPKDGCVKCGGSLHLDTLAQLSPNDGNGLNDNKLRFQKKARSKAITNAVIFPLIDLNSSLKKSYWQSYHCNKVQLQDGNKISGKYCNQRWCVVCNRVRTAKLMNGYVKPLQELEDAYFVTLTIPNVGRNELPGAIDGMTNTLQLIRKNMPRKYGAKLRGIRKLECTYNPKRNDYHPHFHLLIEGKSNSETLVKEWLRHYPKATKDAQNIKQADAGSVKELFKYFTKITTNGVLYPKPLDNIFKAMKGRRVFQPIGIKKDVSEDVDAIISQEIDFKSPQDEIWIWQDQAFDWITADGEMLSEYIPTPKEMAFFDHLKQLRDG